MINFLQNYDIWCHSIGLQFWDIPAGILLVAVAAFVAVKLLKKRGE